jgi:hypothetical protein
MAGSGPAVGVTTSTDVKSVAKVPKTSQMLANVPAGNLSYAGRVGMFMPAQLLSGRQIAGRDHRAGRALIMSHASA